GLSRWDPFDPPRGAGVGGFVDQLTLALPIVVALVAADDDICPRIAFAVEKAAQGADVIRWETADIDCYARRLRAIQTSAVEARGTQQWAAAGITATDPDGNARLLDWTRQECCLIDAEVLAGV